MKLAVITVTEKGVRNGLKIKEKINCGDVVFYNFKIYEEKLFNLKRTSEFF